MYELSVQLNKDCKEMLWWRIIGVTSQRIHERLDEALCYYEMMGCINEVSRLLPKQIEDKGEIEESKDASADLFKLDY